MGIFHFCNYYFVRCFIAFSAVQYANETLGFIVSFLICEMYFSGPFLDDLFTLENKH